jgi:hypothetical protein
MSNWGENSTNAAAFDNIDGVSNTEPSPLTTDPIDVVIDKLLRYEKMPTRKSIDVIEVVESKVYEHSYGFVVEVIGINQSIYL